MNLRIGMDIGIVGLGRMGANIARRLARGGTRVVGYDPDIAARQAVVADSIGTVMSLDDLVAALPTPRIIWMMVPAGAATQKTIDALARMLEAGDLIVDGGNANYKDTQRRAANLAGAGLRFADCGVSGGVWGLANGFALMHNKREFGLDVAAIAQMWQHGSVVRSWLLELTAGFLGDDPELAQVLPVVADSGEGRWTVNEAVEQGIPAPVMSLALMARFASQGSDDYASRLLAMMRKGFGGHAIGTVDEHLS